MRESWRKNELMQQGRRNRGREAKRETKQRQRGREAESTETKWVRRNVRRGVLAFWVKLGWSKVSIKSNGVFWVFFFWISAWIGRFSRYGRFKPELARFGLRRRASARIGENHVGSTWHDAAGRAGSGVPCASPCPAASDAGAAPLVPHLGFPGWMLVLCKTGC